MEISDDLELTADDQEVLVLVRQALSEYDDSLSTMEIWKELYEKKHIGFWHLRDILATAAKSGDDLVWDKQGLGTRHYYLSDKARAACIARP